jgi:DNA topoisomerase 2-associated protein PAT1
MLDHFFQLLSPYLLHLFPSNRLAAAIPPATGSTSPDMDQPVWQFLAALALHASTEQQQLLVTVLREKILEIVTGANKGWVADEDERRAKLTNVNLFLNALGIQFSGNQFVFKNCEPQCSSSDNSLY